MAPSIRRKAFSQARDYIEEFASAEEYEAETSKTARRDNEFLHHSNKNKSKKPAAPAASKTKAFDSRSHRVVSGQLSQKTRDNPLSSYSLSPDRYNLAHLAKVLVNGERDAMLDAVDRLHGRSRVLFDLACFSRFQFVRLSAVKNLKQDEEALTDIAKFCPFDETRSSALDDLVWNGEALVEVACSSHYKDTRGNAIKLMNNAASIMRVAISSPNAEDRSAALGRLSDSALLERVAEECSYRKTRTEALNKLKGDMRALSSLLLLSRHLEVRKTIASMLAANIESIDDPEILAEIANLVADQDVRYLAVGKLWRHPSSLKKVASESRYKDAKSTAIMLLSDMVPNLDDPELLVDVASLSPYEDCRCAAVDRLVGMSSALLSVASKSKYRDTRNLAVTKLKGDVDSLTSVMKLSKYQDTRVHAHKLASTPEAFELQLTKILG